jgi:hypothetical protein
MPTEGNVGPLRRLLVEDEPLVGKLVHELLDLYGSGGTTP